MATLPILDIHSLIAYLVDQCAVAINEKDVQQYWSWARGTGQPWAAHHPASSKHIPLGLYADAARVDTEFGHYKVLGIFVNLPLWRPKSTRYSRWLIFSIKEELLWKHHTLNRVYSRVVWCCNLLFDGTMPSAGPNGEPLPKDQSKLSGLPICQKGYVFAVTELRGDWLYHKQSLRFLASWSGHDVCFKCTARRVGNEEDMYYHVDATSKWLSEEFSLADCLALRMPSTDPRSLSSIQTVFAC